jgi:hypothetical protein
MPRLLYPREREPVAIVQKAGWAPGPVLKSDHAGTFFIIMCSVLHPYLCLCLDCPACCLSPLTVQHNTNMHDSRQDSNPPLSKRSTADPRLRPLGPWDRLQTRNRPVRRTYSESQYRLSYPSSYVQCVHDSIIYLVYVCDNSVSVRPLTTFPTTQLTPWSAVFFRSILPPTTNRNPSTSTKSWSLSCARRIHSSPSHTRHCFYCIAECLV